MKRVQAAIQPTGHVSGRPQYPPPPRSGNAFAAAVLAATADLLLLIAVLGLFANEPLAMQHRVSQLPEHSPLYCPLDQGLGMRSI
jgi:hypothetical protein